MPLVPCRGNSSLSLLHVEAEKLRFEPRPVHIILLGDYDTYGFTIHENIETFIRDHVKPKDNLTFTRIAVTKDQTMEKNKNGKWTLPRRSTVKYDKDGVEITSKRVKNFGKYAVELDAFEPKVLLKLVERAINQYMTAEYRDALRVNEEADRARILELAEAE